MSSIILRIAARNLRLRLVSTLLVGVLLTVGSCSVPLFTGLFDAVDAGMERSIVDSVAGDFQIYDAGARDTLELYGSIAFGEPDVGTILDFSAIKDAVMQVPGVRSVVPMGVSRTLVTGRSTLDAKLDGLRRAVNEGADAEIRRGLKAHIKKLVVSMEGELDRIDKLAADSEESAVQRRHLARAQSAEFWRAFDGTKDQALEAMEFLENKIAPIAEGTKLYIFNYVGTDLEAFSENFDLFEVIEGQAVPKGARGFLINKFMYERFIKHKIARRIDTIDRAMSMEARTLADDEDLKRMVERNVKQRSALIDEMTPQDSAALRPILAKALQMPDADLDALVAEALTMTDANFLERRDLFYRELGPRIRLYRFKVGDMLTLYGQTRSGYQRAVNVKIYGVFRFKGLEKSSLAGGHHLMDLMTFRELYGLTNPVTPEELAALKDRAGVEFVEREDAEDTLFGDEDLIEADDAGGVGGFEVNTHDLAGRRSEAEAEVAAGFTIEELEHGPILSAAVVLEDGVDLDAAMAAVVAAAKDVGVPVKALAWREASGLVGNLTVVMQILTYAVIVAFFVIILVVIANALVLAATNRTTEIGTMRAIGAGKFFVAKVFITETALMLGIFGGLGVAIGALIVTALGSGGIPATSDLQYFLYGGEALFPQVLPQHLWYSLVAIGGGTFVTCLYPAWIAARVAPVKAMQSQE